MRKLLNLQAGGARLLAASKMVMNPKPLVVILGATGAGKSKLALDIGRLLNGEIVNTDAMQVYRGLDIVTNKVSSEEQAICPHHLIGFLSPVEEYTIVDFKTRAFQAIEDIHTRKKLPILCGGTNYYIDAILWDYLIASNDSVSGGGELLRNSSPHTSRKKLEAKESSELHDLLSSIDSQRALMLHPNDKRKIIRSIEVFEQTGKKHSELIDLQRSHSQGHSIGGPLKFSNVCLIWVTSEEEVLHKRINDRVDKMIERGLLQELSNFHEYYNKDRLDKKMEANYEQGIFQSIGFKEFHQYLTAEVGNSDKERILKEAVERMKTCTRQYARYQIRWIRNRILNRPEAPAVYAVDATDPTKWKQCVLNPALKTLQSVIDWGTWVDSVNASNHVFTNVELSDVRPLQPIPSVAAVASKRVKNVCQLCGGKVFMTECFWNEHLASKRHKKALAGQKKRLINTSNIITAYKERLESSNKKPTSSEKQTNSCATDDSIDVSILFMNNSND